MKPISPFARITSVLVLLAALPALASAHPGHSALDWFTTPPHAGHESEYGFWVSTTGILALAYGIYSLGTRKR
jgi:hypothetical protein